MRFVFNKLNSILMILAIMVTVAGYMVMSTGDITISSVMLVIAYAVLFPAAIIIGTDKNEVTESEIMEKKKKK